MIIFVVIIRISDAPLVSLSLGAPLDPYNLMKGADVYLECDIKANPAAKRVEWFQNVSVLHISVNMRISKCFDDILVCVLICELLKWGRVQHMFV